MLTERALKQCVPRLENQSDPTGSQPLPKSIGWAKILKGRRKKKKTAHTREANGKSKSFYAPGAPFQTQSLDSLLKGQNVPCMAIILNLLMVSEQSTVVNKVNVLMPDLWLRVDREQKNTKLTLFFFFCFLPSNI